MFCKEKFIFDYAFALKDLLLSSKHAGNARNNEGFRTEVNQI